MDTITVTAYCQALETWARVAERPLIEVATLREATAHLHAKFSGTQRIQVLCRELLVWSRTQDRRDVAQLQLGIEKSCLLHRLIYSQEPLRTRPCPIHRGHWSGCTPDECPAGCSYGDNVTGWLPETLQHPERDAEAGMRPNGELLN